MTVYFSDLDDYGQGIDINSVLKKYKLFLEAEFTIDHVIFALHEHCKSSNVMPKVSHLLAILKPKAPVISQASYVQACKEYEQNGFNQYTDAYEIKKSYEDQQKDNREIFKVTNEQILAIARSAVKRIEG